MTKTHDHPSLGEILAAIYTHVPRHRWGYWDCPVDVGVLLDPPRPAGTYLGEHVLDSLPQILRAARGGATRVRDVLALGIVDVGCGYELPPKIRSVVDVEEWYRIRFRIF